MLEGEKHEGSRRTRGEAFKQQVIATSKAPRSFLSRLTAGQDRQDAEC